MTTEEAFGGKTRLDELKDEFQELEPRERLEILLEFSDDLPALPARYQAQRDAGENRVHECQTPVFLWVESHDGRIVMHADVPQESPTVRGFVSLLINTFTGEKPTDVLAIKPTLLSELGLVEALGMVRARGLQAILHRVKLEARRIAEKMGS